MDTAQRQKSQKPAYQMLVFWLVEMPMSSTKPENASVNADVDVSVLTPSEAVKVNENVPAFDSTVEGVIVNTLSDCETVAVDPKEPAVTA